MKSTLWLGAAAFAAMFAAGCQDNQALGTERNRTQPDVPAPNNQTVPNGSPQVQGTPIDRADPMAQPGQGVDARLNGDRGAAANPSRDEPTANGARSLDSASGSNPVDSSSARMDNGREVINGEDLSNVPDQVGPLWGDVPGATGSNAGSTSNRGGNGANTGATNGQNTGATNANGSNNGNANGTSTPNRTNEYNPRTNGSPNGPYNPTMPR